MILAIVLLYSCEEKPTPPTVTTTAASEISYTTATSGGNVTDDGGASIIARGICWSTSSNPTIDDDKTIEGTGIGTFASELTGLTSNTTYYVKAYATNSAGTGYGSQVSLTTLQTEVPELTTAEVTSIAQTTAISGGNITDDNGSSVTARGVCWNTSAAPTIADSKTNDGSDKGVFISNLTDLQPGTLYYIRAYATNSVGTSYGNELSFTTLATLPTLTTTAVTSITQTTAKSGGEITSDGGADITARGVCWNTSTSPTISDSKTTNGNGTGSFTSNITDLQTGTTYYMRAYATNSEGTAYGNEINFITLDPPTLTISAATNITSTTAKLNCIVNANNQNVSTAFEYGIFSSYGHTIDATPALVSGSTNKNVSASLEELSVNVTYHYRLKATTADGITYSNDMTFTPIFVIGESSNGGLVFYVDETGLHGLVSSISDQGSYPWGCGGIPGSVSGTFIDGANGVDVGTGYQNTIAIVNGCTTSGIAARICYDLELNGYDDWFLPSIGELDLMYYNLKLNGLGNFSTTNIYGYWSSSQYNSDYAWGRSFFTDFKNYYFKTPVSLPQPSYIRAVRAF